MRMLFMENLLSGQQINDLAAAIHVAEDEAAETVKPLIGHIAHSARSLAGLGLNVIGGCVVVAVLLLLSVVVNAMAVIMC